jgi:predicted ATPase
MLKRVYIDNYRCLVNFTLHLAPTSILLGLNGSGKTTVFEVLNILQKFISGGARVDDVFTSQTLTRWDKRPLQSFELEVEGPNGTYLYKLIIEHQARLKKARVKRETLSLDGAILFDFDKGDVHLFRDDASAGPIYPFDWGQSGLSTLLPRHDNTNLSWFKDQLRRYLIVSLKPDQMRATTGKEDDFLLPGAENFASWYRYHLQEHQKCMFDLTEKISEIFSGFRQFRLTQAGEERILEAEFSRDHEEAVYYRFNELSDGQRALMVLYALLFAADEVKYTLFLDEPENYIALPELQPWLMDLKDNTEESEFQTVIISHHPEYIDYLGPSHGIWFKREEGGPTRIGKLAVPIDNILKLSELIERGWEDGES